MSIYKFNSIFHQVDIALLRHFYAIATFGGFSKASAATGVSQPALSLGLQKLEKSIGVVLIDRSTRPFILTKEGRSLLSFCQKFEGSFESIIASLGKSGISLRKKFRIGTALSIGVAPLGKVFAYFNTQKEPSEIDVISQNSYDLLSDIYDGKLDGAFVPDDVYDSRFDFTPILKDQVIFVVGKKFRGIISGKGSRSGMDQVPLITFPRDTPLRLLTDKICMAEGLNFKTIYSVNSMEGLKALVEGNHGGSFVLRSLVERELREAALYEERFPFKLPRSGIMFATRADRAKDSKAENLLKMVKSRDFRL